MKIVTLGSCCKKSRQNHINAVEAAKICGVGEPVNIGDMMEIMNYGVLQTPALVIDGKVIASGRVMSVDEIVTLIRKGSI